MFPFILERETKPGQERKFFSQLASPNVGLVGRLQHRAATLSAHDGCVNTVSFTNDGERLISGSDDQSIIIWDWNAGVS
jgi:DDB1- and CUL4-associated factor 8